MGLLCPPTRTQQLVKFFFNGLISRARRWACSPSHMVGGLLPQKGSYAQFGDPDLFSPPKENQSSCFKQERTITNRKGRCVAP